MKKRLTDYFPFHYIDLPIYAQDGSIEYKKPFIEQVERILQNDLQEYDTFGCLIKNCHTHAGSKLHFHDFFEAELLFHNSYYNRSFAQLTMDWLWNDYIRHEDKYENVLLIGYEMYSELYLQELRGMLREKKIKNCEYCVYETVSKSLTNGARKKETHIRNLRRIENGVIEIDYGNRIVQFEESSTLCVFIVAINTSLSTMDKMIAKFLGNTDNEKDVINRAHICLITLGTGGDKSFFDLKDGMLNPCKHRFENLEKDEHYIKNLVHINVNSDTLARKCPECFPIIKNEEETMLTDEKPMFGVNRDSVVPMLKIGQKKYPEPIDPEVSDLCMNNLSKVYELSEFLQYRHIARGDNHYQYYFDTEKFLQENFENIEIFLEELGNNFNSNSTEQIFDYIVAPRHQSNSGWVHIVNKKVFNGCARIIYFDVEKEFRSNIKAKYSDLISALEHIQNSGQRFLVRFHFVDDAIQSGSTFLRAKNLFNSLTEGVADKNSISLFNSIILIINRLSTDSKRFYLGNENADRFYYYVDVNISSMRNYEDACTLCKLISDYHVIINECATNRLADICTDVIKRHEIYSSFDIDKVEKDNHYNRQEKKYIFYISHLLNECMDSKLIFEKNIFSTDATTIPDEIKQFLLRCYDSQALYNNLGITENIDKQLLKIALIKAASRPFFVYHIRFRQAAFAFCLTVTDQLLFSKDEPDISYIVNTANAISDRLEKISEIDKDEANKLQVDLYTFYNNIMQFPNEIFYLILLKTLVKALADMNANYLVRKKVLEKLFKCAKKGEELYNSLKRLINLHVKLNEKATLYEDRFKKQYDLNYIFTGMFTNDSLLHSIKKDIVLSRDETKSLLLEYVLLYGNEQAFFETNNIIDNVGIKDFIDENYNITIEARLYLENNTIVKNILNDEGNLDKLIKELAFVDDAYRADELYFFENFQNIWEINTDKLFEEKVLECHNSDRVLSHFKTFFENYRTLKNAIDSFATTDANNRVDFSRLINRTLEAIGLEEQLKVIAFVHDNNEKNPLFRFYTIADVSKSDEEELPDCIYNKLNISQAFFHDDNINEIKDKLDSKKTNDIFFTDDKLTNNNSKTLIIRFSNSINNNKYYDYSLNKQPDESIYIQIFGFKMSNKSHWFALKLLLSLRENFVKLIANVNLQELIEERKVEMKQKALSINKATTHSKAEKYFMSRPVTENISHFKDISNTIIEHWKEDEHGNMPKPEILEKYKLELKELDDINRIERKGYSIIMKLPSYKLRHRWTLYDKYYQLLSDEMLSSFYRKVIAQQVRIKNKNHSIKKAIETVFDPVETELLEGLDYRSQVCITMHNESGNLTKCKIIFEFERGNKDGTLPYTYEYTCNMSIYVFIIIIMAMNAVQHGTSNGDSDIQTLTVKCSYNKLQFINKVSKDNDASTIDGQRFWYIPPWVFDERNQHITLWTLIHMSQLQDGIIEFRPRYNKDTEEFITEFIFKEVKK